MFEVGDLRDCMMYELEGMIRFPVFLEPLEAGIRGVYDAMREGRYSFGREDLPFMDIAAAHAGEIPFHALLKQINDTHRRGLDVGDDGE